MSRGVALLGCGIALFLGLASCARMEAPSGGPEDNVPPIVVSTRPDTFAVLQDFEGPVVLEFSERISERPQGGTVDDAVVVSPATSEVEVDFQRSAIEVSLEEGFEPGRVYRVRVNPVVVDMFSNPLLDPFELVFSTGPDFSSGAVAGVVLDRITGDPVPDARVHAAPREEADTVPYVSRTDEEGIFALRYLSPGSYRVTAFQDRNRSGGPDLDEARQTDSVTLESAADTVLLSLEILAPDTTPPRVMDVVAVDSVSLRIEIDDVLDPTASLDPVEIALTRTGEDAPAGAPDGLPGGVPDDAPDDAPGVDTLLHAHEWEARRDSLQALAATAAAAADTSVAATDTSAAGAGGGAGGVPPAADGGGAPPGGAGTPGAGGAPGGAPGPRAPEGPPRSEQEIYALLASPLEAGVEYSATVTGIENLQGTGGGGGEAAFVWEPPPPDTAAAPGADTIPPPDGANVPPADAGDPGPDQPADTTDVPADGPGDPAGGNRR